MFGIVTVGGYTFTYGIGL